MTGVAQAPARQRVIEEEEMIEIEREPRERAETGRVIAHVRAEIPPEHQAQTLRDLARTADGEPQLDATMLEEAAAALADARAPIELVRRDTGELAALACGRCGTVQGLSDPKRARWLVGQCCAPRFCGSCGGLSPRGWARCDVCQARLDEEREREAIAAATRVSLADYLAEMGADAMVCTERLGGEEHYTHPSYCDEPWAWACTRQSWGRPDAESVAEQLCKDMYDGAIERLDVTALQALLDAWIEKQGDARAWMVDGTRIVVLREEER